MTPERYKQVCEICDAAMTVAPDRRESFLRQACLADEDLRREVESLLAAQQQSDSFMESPAIEAAARAFAKTMSNPATGRRIGRFEVLSLLGRGGMGDVYLAKDARLGRKIALKLLPAQFTQDTERLRRFEQEARAASALNHPNIVTIHEIGEAEGARFIATEFIDGHTLRERLREKRMAARDALNVATQVAAALTTAHAAGIVHRDIKPENVMLRHDGYVKVLDFGLAKLAQDRLPRTDPENAETKDSLTVPGIVMGTVNYMSPEQARGLNVDARSDIFSLAVVIYEMFAGCVPFTGGTASDVIASILRSPPAPLARYGADAVPELERIVLKALAKDVEERYQTMKDLALDLKNLAQDLEFHVRLERTGSGSAKAPQITAQLLCPSCGAGNPRIAKFCLSCGVSLANRCSNCETDLLPGARFCTSCGQQVGGLTAADNARHQRLAAATPGVLADKIRGEGQRVGERRVVTALLADLAGTTESGGPVDPEDWTAILNSALDRFSPVIYRYEGTVARLLGNSLLAFFGAPVAHEDDPARAARATIELLTVALDYRVEVQRRYGVVFELRIGLNTGPIIIGAVASDLKYEYTVTGETVNLAALLYASAPPMTALMTEHTHRFLAPLFECTDFGPLAPLSTKGKSVPVQVYELRGSKAEPGQLRGLAGLQSPMVGRNAELAGLLQLNAAAQAGLGRAAVIIGEPGLGKTRLIAEWRNAALKTESAATPQWHEGHCLSYGRSQPYHLLIDLLQSLLGVAPTANEDETRVALLLRAGELFGAAAMDSYPYLAHLLSLKLEGAALERVRELDPQGLQHQYLTAIRRLLHALAARSPLIVVLEDIHWADPSSTELLIKLLPLVSETRTTFCLVTRPDLDAPGWRLITAARDLMGARLTEMTLAELTEADSQQLIGNMLDLPSLNQHTRTLILKKAEGNPLFVEEVIRMLIERGAIVRDGEKWIAGSRIAEVEIPDNLQGLLLARIDRLPDDVKHTLRVASVIGRQFAFRVLEGVMARDSVR